MSLENCTAKSTKLDAWHHHSHKHQPPKWTHTKADVLHPLKIVPKCLLSRSMAGSLFSGKLNGSLSDRKRDPEEAKNRHSIQRQLKWVEAVNWEQLCTFHTAQDNLELPSTVPGFLLSGYLLPLIFRFPTSRPPGQFQYLLAPRPLVLNLWCETPLWGCISDIRQLHYYL